MEWRACDPMTGRIMGILRPSSWSCSDPLIGAGGGSMEVPVSATSRATREVVRSLTKPDDTIAYALWDGATYLWTGMLTDREWRRKTGTLSVTLEDWRAWFYTAVLRPTATTGGLLSTTGDFIRTGTEQAVLMRQLAELALDDPAAPEIIPQPPGNTGVLRDLTVRRWKNMGEALDQLGGRERGMEWWVEAVPHPSLAGYVQWQWKAAYPGRSSRSFPLSLSSTPRGGNLSDYSWPESSKERRSRVTALGEGEAPDTVAATDSNPLLAGGTVLLREQVSGPYSGVTSRATAFGHAQAERLSRDAAVQSVTVTVDANRVPPSTYVTGDRARLRILDEWLDVDLEGARIIDRTLKGGRTTPFTADLTLDLNDAEMPNTSSQEES